MTFKKVKSKAMFGKMMKHNFRQDYCENVNKSMSHLNEELIPMEKGQTYKSAFEKKIYDSPYYRDHSIRKNAVLAMDVILTFSSKNLPENFDLEGWKRANTEWLEETYGKENVISAVLHMDERVPHIHAIVIPMHEQKLNCSHYISGKESMRELQDSYGEKMSEFGLERGQRYTVAKHEEVQKFYAAIEEASAKELPAVDSLETAVQYRERAQVVFRKANLQHLDELKTMEAKIAEVIGAGAEARIAHAQSQKELETAERKIKALEEQNKALATKGQRMDELVYAIRNGLPSEVEAEEFKKAMIKISGIARERMDNELLGRSE